MRISLVAAYDKKRTIGQWGRMPWHLPADLKRFRRLTWGKPCLMGRRTFEAIGRPLPGRENLVLSRSITALEGALVFPSLEEALGYLEGRGEVMVIGGSELFRQLLPLASRLYLTEIEGEFPGDVFFPEWQEEAWIEVERQTFPATERFPFAYRFRTLLRREQGERHGQKEDRLPPPLCSRTHQHPP